MNVAPATPWSSLRLQALATTLPETNIAGWKIPHFDGMKPRKDGIFMGELLVSGRVIAKKDQTDC